MPAKAASAKANPAKATPAKAAPVKNASAKAASIKAAKTKVAPTKAASVKATPVKKMSAKTVPTKAAPAKTASTKAATTKAIPAPKVSTKAIPAKAANKQKVKSTASANTPSANGKKRVVLSLQAEHGADVFVAGTFNNWNPDQKQLSFSKEKGIYSCTLMLEPGTYEYKFRVNNTWTIDQNNPSFTRNDLGTLNNVLIVQ